MNTFTNRAETTRRELAHIAELRAALDTYESHCRFFGADSECEDYREVLSAFYSLSEIDQVWEVAQSIRWADEDLYGNPIPSRAAREAGRAFDEAGVL